MAAILSEYSWLKDVWLPVTALIWGGWTYYRQNLRRLSIRQVGGSVTDRVTRVNDTVTTFQVEVAITNDSPHATVVIAYYHLELPWNDPQFEPLPDPVPRDVYKMPGSSLEWQREWVINHRRYQFGKLEPGDCFQGLFLARGLNPLPRDLVAKSGIEIQFVVQDTRGKMYKRPVTLWPQSW